VISGRGFAFQRRQKVERKYRKLLKKEQKNHLPREDQFTDTYPEHLKHLYLAEEERLRKQKQTLRAVIHCLHHLFQEERPVGKAVLLLHFFTLPYQHDCCNEQQPVTTEGKFKKKTSNQKAKEEYEKIQAERAKKREEAEKRRQQREAAQKLYKQKKMQAYKILSKKTKKGQPNLNIQMEFLLQKIQQ
ncbi:TAP26 protein, partial [Penelope pileata]|nr:TAP26 protein [Penelope pileata]